VPIAPPTFKERLMDHLATVIAVLVVAAVLAVLFGPMLIVEIIHWFRWYWR